METKEIEKKEIDQVMEIDGSMMSILNETRKWTKFLSILGFIGIGIMIIVGIFAGSIFSSTIDNSITGGMGFPSVLFSFIYIIMAAIYFIPVLFLFNFSNKMKVALFSNNQEALYEAFNNLKRHFKFIGILVIVLLVIYVTIFIGVGIMALIAG